MGAEGVAEVVKVINEIARTDPDPFFHKFRAVAIGGRGGYDGQVFDDKYFDDNRGHFFNVKSVTSVDHLTVRYQENYWREKRDGVKYFWGTSGLKDNPGPALFLTVPKMRRAGTMNTPRPSLDPRQPAAGLGRKVELTETAPGFSKGPGATTSTGSGGILRNRSRRARLGGGSCRPVRPILLSLPLWASGPQPIQTFRPLSSREMDRKLEKGTWRGR